MHTNVESQSPDEDYPVTPWMAEHTTHEEYYRPQSPDEDYPVTPDVLLYVGYDSASAWPQSPDEDYPVTPLSALDMKSKSPSSLNPLTRIIRSRPNEAWVQAEWMADRLNPLTRIIRSRPHGPDGNIMRIRVLSQSPDEDYPVTPALVRTRDWAASSVSQSPDEDYPVTPAVAAVEAVVPVKRLNPLTRIIRSRPLCGLVPVGRQVLSSQSPDEDYPVTPFVNDRRNPHKKMCLNPLTRIIRSRPCSYSYPKLPATLSLNPLTRIIRSRPGLRDGRLL